MCNYGGGVAQGNRVSTVIRILHVPHSSVGEPPLYSSLTRVGSITPSRSDCSQLLIRISGPAPGATHLYLLDFVPDNLPGLKEMVQKKYPDVKVRWRLRDQVRENQLRFPRSQPCKQMLRTKPPSLPFAVRR